jgi:hypothetical protein
MEPLKDDKKEIVEKCITEVEDVLKKHGCRMIVRPTDFFGQKVYEPVIVIDTVNK